MGTTTRTKSRNTQPSTSRLFLAGLVCIDPHRRTGASRRLSLKLSRESFDEKKPFRTASGGLSLPSPAYQTNRRALSLIPYECAHLQYQLSTNTGERGNESERPRLAPVTRPFNVREWHYTSRLRELGPTQYDHPDAPYYLRRHPLLSRHRSSTSSHKWETYRWLQKGLDARRE